MPGYRGHIVGGCCIYGILVVLLPLLPSVSITTYLEWLLCAVAGALFPDVDIKSRGQKYFYYCVLCVVGVCIIQQSFVGLAVCSLGAVVPLISRHRGMFHAWWFVFFVPMIFWLCIKNVWPHLAVPLWYDMIFFIAGAISHIVLDKKMVT
ncbi:MAG TPA: metal-dependent hydrolase [Candidatus Bathyarchaeia archaeon]|nr:metal-dependent hydrolase [Candidatus Bathyarchaeia archaeon]